jgi:hypothetical protein
MRAFSKAFSSEVIRVLLCFVEVLIAVCGGLIHCRRRACAFYVCCGVHVFAIGNFINHPMLLLESS